MIPKNETLGGLHLMFVFSSTATATATVAMKVD